MTDEYGNMDQRHRDRMDECRERIVPHLREHMHDVWPKLLDNKIFNSCDVNIPRWIKSLDDEETTRDVYTTIKTRGPHAFEGFLSSLRQSNLGHLATLLDGNGNEDSLDPIHNRVAREINENEDESSEPSTERNQDGFSKYIQRWQEPLKIEVQKATKFLDDATLVEDIERYPMRSKPRGVVLIITNIMYQYSTQEPRYSARHDEKNLQSLFEQMGFKVSTYRDLTGQEIMDTVLAFSRQEELRKVDSCFVIISGHGHSQGTETDLDPRSRDTEIAGTDYISADAQGYRKVTCADVIDCFTAKACPNLTNKPKIFIFQVCRGDMKQKAVPEPRHTMDVSTYMMPSQDDSRSRVPDKARTRNYSDMLVAHSTLPGYASFRDTLIGSWFIQILCEVFMNHACRMHIQDLFTMIDDRLSMQRATLKDDPEQRERCQTPTITSLGFNKHCYINPGLFE